jgi:hypothetical protein
MDEGYVRAVLTVFKTWFERGLIYRGYRLGNWSSGAQTDGFRAGNRNARSRRATHLHQVSG